MPCSEGIIKGCGTTAEDATNQTLRGTRMPRHIHTGETDTHWGGTRRGGGRRGSTFLVAVTLAATQLLSPVAPLPAYGEGTVATSEELYDLWDAVLDATDAEAEARARLNSAMESQAETSARMDDVLRELEQLAEERDGLASDLSDLVGFANDPDSDSKAYGDAVMGVVDAIERLSESQEALDAAKSEYASARQSLSDLRDRLDASEDGQVLRALDEELAGIESELADRDDVVSRAEGALEEAQGRLASLLDGTEGDEKATYDAAQAELDGRRSALDGATAARASAEEQVMASQEALDEHGDEPQSYEVSDLGTPGEYMDGIDISSYQDGIDLTSVPVDFVIVKALEGPNPEGEWYGDGYEGKVDQAIEAGKCVGLYHFYTTNATPEAQAERFAERASGYVGQAALFLDWESRTYSGGRGSSPVSSLDPSVAKAWLDRVYELTGVKPGIYMSRSVTTAHDWSEVAAEYPLWVAAYPSTTPASGYAESYKEPYEGNVGAWARPIIWQYSATTYLPNWRGWLDVNVMYGNRSDWALMAGQDWGTRLERDRQALDEAVRAEEDARTELERAEDIADAAADVVRGLSAELEEAFDSVEAADGSLRRARDERDATQVRLDDCESRRQDVRSRNEGLLAEMAEAEARMDAATQSVSDAEEAVSAAESGLAASQHRKDMFKRIFEAVNAGEDMPAGDGDPVPEYDPYLGGATDGEDGTEDGSSHLGLLDRLASRLVSLLAPTTAHADPGRRGLTDGALPLADAIIADPSLLDGFIAQAQGDDVRELLSDMQEDARRIADIESRIASGEEDRQEMEAELERLRASVEELEGEVAAAQEGVSLARDAYREANPDGGVEEPEGYPETRRLPDTGATGDELEDNSLVFLWGDMFALGVAATVGLALTEERRLARRKGL